jgi:hypothetical protein
MAIKDYSSRIYASLPIALLMSCQSNGNLPKQPPDKVAEEAKIMRESTATTVNNKPITQENTDTIEREREQADDISHISPQDSTATTRPINAARSFAQDGVVDTDEESFNKKFEQKMVTRMLNAMHTEQSYSSDDGEIAQEYAELNASTEEDKNDLDQLAQDIVHDTHAAILEIPGSM